MKSCLDLHVHLYGCLGADAIFQLTKQALPMDFAAFRAAYEVRAQLDFAAFQQKFNLLIGLLPLTPKDETVVEWVLSRQTSPYVEYRCFLPDRFSPKNIDEYLATLARSFGCHSTPDKAKIVLSLSRQPSIFLRQYKQIHQAIEYFPSYRRWFVGIDLCGDEEQDILVDKENLFAQVLRDNKKAPDSALALLVHAGESFASYSLGSAVSKVMRAVKIGAHRIGHATALGIDPGLLVGTEITESASQRLDYLSWLLENAMQLKNFGYNVEASEIRREIAAIARERSAGTTISYDISYIEEMRALQTACMGICKAQDVVIECCPASNFFLSAMRKWTDHPIKRFMANGVNVCLGSDDPGLFGSSIENEFRMCSEEIGLSMDAMDRIYSSQEGYMARVLAAK